jgi:hypothetical protein
VTGHSLGGALASLCAYDLSTTVAEAQRWPATKDPVDTDEYRALQVRRLTQLCSAALI